MTTFFEFERDYSAHEIAGLYDFVECLLPSGKLNGKYNTFLRFDFSRVLKNEKPAVFRLKATTKLGEVLVVDAEAKFFTNVQTLEGFHFFAVAIVVVTSDEKQGWALPTTTYEILTLRFTDDVDDKVKKLQFFM